MKFLTLILFIFSLSTLPAQQYENMRIVLDSSLQSEALGYSKHVQLVAPMSYDQQSNRGYPLIVVFDMQNAINYKYIINTIDYLSGFGQIPECLVIGIDAADRAGRYRETQIDENDNNVLGDQNESFIFEELIPYLQENFNANEQIILFGHSRFGYFTTHLLTQRPHELLGVISVSPFYYQDKTDHVQRLTNMLSEVSLEHDLYYIPSVGDTVTDTGEFYKMTSAMNEINKPEKFILHPISHPAADHIVTPGLSASEGLYTIFCDWSILQMQYHRTALKDLKAVHEKLQQEIEASYGARVPFSLGIYNGTGWRFYNDSQYIVAIQSWELMMYYYPAFSYGWVFIASALSELNRINEVEPYLQLAEQSLIDNHYLTDDEVAEILSDIAKLRE